MKTVRQCLWECVLVLAVFSSCISAASASPEMRKAAILSAMTEAALSSVSLMHDHLHKDLKNFNWTSTFSDRDMAFRGEGFFGDSSDGVKFSFTLTGYLWGDDQQDLSLTYSGLGYANDEPIRLNGRSDWAYNKDKSDYMNMDFRHVMKFGKNSYWGWIVGSEIIMGGALGAGGAIAGTAAATGGVALGAALWIGAKGAAEGASALVAVSTLVKTLTESHEPVDQPKQPDRPTPPLKGNPIRLAPDQILTAVSKNGQLLGKGPDKLVLSGKYDNIGGSAEGGIMINQD